MNAWEIFERYFEALRHEPKLAVDISRSAELAVAKMATVSLIDQTLADTYLVIEAAKRSYIHDNGFVKIVFNTRLTKFAEVRLHVWAPPLLPQLKERSGFPSNIHNHSADFVSILMKGKMRESVFSALRPEGVCNLSSGIYSRYWCGSRGETDSYGMTYLDDSVLWPSSHQELEAGNLHGMVANILHQITVHERPAITLFVQGPRRSAGTTVYAATGPLVVGSVASPALDAETVALVLRWARGELSSLP